MSVGDVKAEPCPFCGKSTAPEHINYDNCFVVRCLHCGYVSAHTASERGAIENHNKICRLLPKPDPDWKDICAKCRDGEIEPDCEYYGEPNGCNSPIYGEHPIAKKSSAVGNAAAMEEIVLAMAWVILPERKEDEEPWLHWLRAMQAKARAALAKPPRNCDRFVTLREARDAWFAAEVSPRLADKPMDHDEIPFPDWLFATVNEREDTTTGCPGTTAAPDPRGDSQTDRSIKTPSGDSRERPATLKGQNR
ncbi:MAG: hypothetical protein IJG13_13415 [Kiritimatiellae bacterium]|nr:hypothetical protein [Kiritimatiellia bacterium]MBQ3344491.1 hypothetical protein [Kiritimatiellia bacterium]